MKRRAGGFTLIEVLLATVLLASGLALAFATLRSATQLVERGESMAQRNERIRAVEGFLRTRIASARMIAFETETETLRPVRFVGEPQRMRFVADLPDYLGRGGPYLHDIGVGDDGDLQVAFAMAQAGRSVDEGGARAPEMLADRLDQVRFQYRGLAQDGQLGEWQDNWAASESLPLQVRVDISSADGTPWPPLLVTLAQGGGAGAALAGGDAANGALR